MNKPLSKIIVSVLMFTAINAPIFTFAAENSINIYSYRQPFLMKPLIDGFEKDTGIKANIIYAKKGWVEKVKAARGKDTADIILTTDIGRLNAAVIAELADPIESEILTNNILPQYRDVDNQWFGLTSRSRVIYASKERVKQNTITYEELAEPKWKGKVCIRSGQNAYNLGLFSSMIANLGEEKAQKWLEGLKANLAHSPKGNDRAQAKSIFNGECDVAIANTYYMGKMVTNEKNPEQKDWAAGIKLLFPNSEGRGVHMNISGALVVKGARNKADAVKFIEYLSQEKAQAIYAKINFERSVNPNVGASDLVKSWGEFKPDSLSLNTVASGIKRASELVDIVGFDK